MSLAFETAEARLRERLSEDAAAHCLRVSEFAGLLAGLYAVDVEDARLAGLLHDWDREQDASALLAACEVAGRPLEPADRHVPYLLHARTGAASVRQQFPELSDEIVNAVERHTLGAPEMTDLDMVVYIADMIEPGRRFKGVDDLREVVGCVSLRDLFALAYQRTVAHIVEAQKTIHPLTVTVWNNYVARSQS